MTGLGHHTSVRAQSIWRELHFYSQSKNKQTKKTPKQQSWDWSSGTRLIDLKGSQGGPNIWTQTQENSWAIQQQCSNTDQSLLFKSIWALTAPTIPRRANFLRSQSDQLTSPTLHQEGMGRLIQERSETPAELTKRPLRSMRDSCVHKAVDRVPLNLLGCRPISVSGHCRSLCSRTSCQLPRKEVEGAHSLVTQCCHRPGSRPHSCQEPGWGGRPAPGQGQPAAPLCWGWILVHRTQDTSPGSPASSSLDVVKRDHK